MKCARYVMKNCNEMWVSNEKLQRNTPGINLKNAMKCTGLQNHNEMHRVCNEKPQWNVLGIYWKVPMKNPGIHLKNHNEIPWVCNEKSHPGAKNEIAIESAR